MTEDAPGSHPAAVEDPRGLIESLREAMARRNAEQAATLARLAEAP